MNHPSLHSTLPLKGNQTLLLTDPSQIWLVQSGMVALFAVTVQDGVLMGARRYLFSCGVKDGLFGILPLPMEGPQGTQRCIMAVSLQQTELARLDLSSFQRLANQADPDAIALIDRWLEQLNGVLERVGIGFVPVVTEVNGQAEKELEPDQLPTGGFVSDGSSRLGNGLANGTVNHVQPPVSNGNVQGSSRLTLLDTFHQHFVQCLDQLEQQETASHWFKVQVREQFNRQLAEDTLQEMAALLENRRVVGRDPSVLREVMAGRTASLVLHRAAIAVGQALDIPIRIVVQSGHSQRIRDPLDAIARASGVRVRQVLLSDRWWQRDCGPLLGYLRDGNQPVALLPDPSGRYTVLDPVRGTTTPLDERLRSHLAPIAHMFYRSLPPVFGGWLQFLRFGLRDRGKDLLTVIWTGIAIALLGMLTPQATAILIDYAIPGSDRGLLLQMTLGLVAVAIGGLVFQLVQGVALMRLETLVDASLQTAIWDRLMSLGIPFFRQYTVGDLRNRASSINIVRRQLSGTPIRTLFFSVFGLLNLGLLFYYSPPLAWIVCLIAAIGLSFTGLVAWLSWHQIRRVQESEGKLLGLVVQLINGVAKLRVAGAEMRAFAYWGKRYNHQQRLKVQLQRTQDNLVVFNQVIPVISLMLVIGGMMVVVQSNQAGITNLSTGTFLAFNAAFGSFMVSLTGLSAIMMDVLQMISQIRLVKPILVTAPEVTPNQALLGQLSGKVALENVTFGYRSDAAPVLQGVNLYAEAGEFVAIVGPSGSGKSTILRLMLGFDTPQSGQIRYDGQDLRSLNIHAVRRQLGVVMQTSRTMTASIFENIAGSLQISLEEAWEAAQLAGFADDVMAMPMGMHTVVSEGGGNLSGGQRQRLMIARALALRPRILLFDEATSSLDNRTQAIISQSLNDLKITRIVIAHRLSTIQSADRIYVMQAGQVIEQGRYDDLIQHDGLFTRLSKRQII